MVFLIVFLIVNGLPFSCYEICDISVLAMTSSFLFAYCGKLKLKTYSMIEYSKCINGIDCHNPVF